MIFFFKLYTVQQSHPMLKIPIYNSCKRQNPVPRSLPLSIHWTLLTRQRLKGVLLGHSQNQPLYRFVSASHPRNRVVSENSSTLSSQRQAQQFHSWQVKTVLIVWAASQEKLPQMRPVAELQGTEEVTLRNPLLLFSFWEGKDGWSCCGVWQGE